MEYQHTSREAWLSMQGKPNISLDAKIILALDAAGKAGLICEEIENTIERTHQAVSGNLRHLVERGVVLQTDQRGKTSSGRSAIKWVCCWWGPYANWQQAERPKPPPESLFETDPYSTF